MMFGFACDDNAEYKPTAMVIMQEFSKFYDELRQKDSRFLADGKTQLTGEYDDNMRLVKIKDWTISYQNTETDRAETDRILIDKAREIAVDYLKRYKLHSCEVQLSYAIGIAEPLAIYINGDGKNITPEPELYAACTPKNIIKDLDLLHKKY